MVGGASAAHAQVEGCDPRVMAAMQAAAEAKTAYDNAVTEQVTNKPDSVLAMTCFNQAASVSAKKAGEIFSGDFTSDLSTIITPGLADHYRNFENAPGFDRQSVDYSGTATNLTADTFDCPAMQRLWDQTADDPVPNNVPYPDFDELAAGTIPAGAGDDFRDSLEASEDSFSSLKAAEDNLPAADVPDFTGADSACEVMQRAGIAGDCP